MRVLLVAHSVAAINPETDDYALKEIGYRPHQRDPDQDEIVEAAGRLCYLSWERPNPATATNEGYLANILNHGHYSVLEHCSATFYLGGVSRALTHELVRHRHLSFSQVSQRYVDESVGDFIYPGVDQGLDNTVADLVHEARRQYDSAVGRLHDQGLGRKQARDAARYLLPNAVATQIMVSGNFRAYRDMFAKRISGHASPEIRGVAQLMLKELLRLAPNSFQDMKELIND